MPEGRLLVVDNSNLFVLVVLVIVNIRPQALVEVLVNDLSLAVCLRVISCRELKLSTYTLAELVPKV